MLVLGGINPSAISGRVGSEKCGLGVFPGKAPFALNMIRAKIDSAQVATLTGLSIERVSSIYLDIYNPEQST